MGHGGQELQWGPDPCALGRFPEGNAPHLYRQVQGGANRDPAQRPVTSETHLFNARATSHSCPETNFNKKHHCLLNV